MITPSEFEQQSDWIDLDAILSDCCTVGADVIVYGKVNRFRGVIECVNADCTRIQIKYDADESGYPDSHVLETCDVDEIRCKICCDVNWFEIDECQNPDLTGLPDYPPDGQAYLYSGDFNDPDCIFLYQGFGPFKDISSYTKISNNDVVSFSLDEYDLTITLRDGTEYTVTLVKNTLASACFDSFPLDSGDLEELT